MAGLKIYIYIYIFKEPHHNDLKCSARLGQDSIAITSIGRIDSLY